VLIAVALLIVGVRRADDHDDPKAPAAKKPSSSPPKATGTVATVGTRHDQIDSARRAALQLIRFA
jgi:hypothetical protein